MQKCLIENYYRGGTDKIGNFPFPQFRTKNVDKNVGALQF